jgi:hypothetical protein
MSEVKEQVKGKDLVVGQKYYIKSGEGFSFLGNFSRKDSEYYHEPSYTTSGTAHFYVFKNEHREQRIRDYDGSETFYKTV